VGVGAADRVASRRPDPLLDVDGLRVSVPAGEILRGVDLRVGRGEIVGVVGESGSGKTTLGLAVLGLLGVPRQVTGGEIRFGGTVIGASGIDHAGPLRGRHIGFVPQDPFRSFDPLRRIGSQVRRPLELHLGLSGAEAGDRATTLLARLGVPEPERVMSRYPHQLSGGMLQRAAIATALSCGPELVIADEPTTALDVLVQVQVIDAFLGLVRDLGTSVVIITHDLRLLRRTADHVAAMYAGRVVEFGPRERVLAHPRHPYPAALLAASLVGVEPGGRVASIEGQPPALPGAFPPCPYAPRCPRSDETCLRHVPTYAWPANEGEACHHPLGPGATEETP
jgi:peptide/nickel transport system ATP-binding protein